MMTEETFDELMDRLEVEICQEVEEIPELKITPFARLDVNHQRDIIRIVSLTAIRAYQKEVNKELRGSSSRIGVRKSPTDEGGFPTT